jgi:hypothetical protein
MRAAACLLLGLLALAAGVVATLARSPQLRTGTNGVVATRIGGRELAGSTMCQSGESVPAGTGALRLWILTAEQAPPATVVLRQDGRVVARGTAMPVPQREVVTARIPRTTREYDDVDVCVALGSGVPTVMVVGPRLPDTGAVRVNGRLRPRTSLPIMYMAAGDGSWLSRAGTVSGRIGDGRGGWGGGWVAWAAALLVLAAIALVVRAVLKTLVAAEGDGDPPEQADPPDEATGRRRWWRRAPAIAWTIAAVAVLNAVAWSLITPPFQVPDEQTHFAYAQLIAERGRLPAPREHRDRLAPELQTVIEDLHYQALAPGAWSQLQKERLDRDLHASLARSAGGQAGPAAPEPPLYYAVEAIPYRVASGATLLDRLALMRLLSAVLAGVTALFAFLFVRECLPGRPWAWTVGALGVALTPLLGFISGGVNPDALLFALCAVLFHALAVAFRRGLTTRLAIRIGVLLALGIVGKINFYGLVPGALLAVALAARTSAGGWNRAAGRLVAIVLALAVGPFLLLSALDALLWDRSLILARTPAEAPESHGGLSGQLSYLWQVFLPRLPGQSVAIREFAPTYELWLKGFIGKFGWLKVHYARWAYLAGTIVLGVIGALALRSAIAERATLRRRLPELIGYASMTAGLLLLIGLVALRGWAPGIEGAVQGRYLLPLLPLFGALLALAARGAGARWGRTVGVALVLACVAWSLFGQLATIAWFYG